MPPGLLDLPQDALDSCLEGLLPSLSPAIFSGVPVPEDLIQVMLVCKRLHDLALPFAWRRLYISPTETTLRDGGTHDGLLGHPERFVHVRMLFLDTIRSFFKPNFQLFVSAFKQCIAFMDNLQVLRWEAPEDFEQFDDILIALASKPRLHTLSTRCYAPEGLPTMVNLRRLEVAYLPGGVRLLDATPFLESLSIYSNARTLMASRIPWNTLRDIKFHSCPDLEIVLKDFSRWKRKFPQRQSPLEKIVVNFEELFDDCESSYWDSSPLVEKVLHVFNALNIRTFSLVDFSSDDAAGLIRRIAQAFPRIQILTLVTESECKWERESDLAEALGSVSLLQELRWNYPYAGGRSRSRMDPRQVLPLIARHCHALERVTLFDWKSYDATFLIKRHSSGKYKGFQEVLVQDGGASIEAELKDSWSPEQCGRI